LQSHIEKIEDLEKSKIKKLEIYVEQLVKWQSKYNLVANSTLSCIWDRHILDSLQLCNYINGYNEKNNKKFMITDLGSGAGFPGMVLAIMSLGDVHLIESSTKKCVFLQEIARLLSIRVKIHNTRIEKMNFLKSQVITARALAPLNKLLSLSFPFFKNGSKGIFLKGKNVFSEIKKAKNDWKIRYRAYPSITDSSGVVLCVDSVKGN
tara:strand:+ start:1278 stop:1898 length:621 start_codon:yes stop_codon:yes gene_type:complete